MEGRDDNDNDYGSVGVYGEESNDNTKAVQLGWV